MADIPGLIEGAHLGRGLGIRFLKHVERTRLLLHMIDVSDQVSGDPSQDYGALMKELESFSPRISAKPMLLVASKIDAAVDGHRLKALRSFAEANGMRLYEISSVTGQGVDELKWATWRILERAPRESLGDLTRAER
jgi:GTP-binding protein